jgi:D-alanine transaminase
MMHEDGLVTEGGSSNVWIVRNGTIYTRPTSCDILAGITRDVVLEVARDAGVPVQQRAFTVEQAIAADECFMTSATSFVLPVTQIGDKRVANGVVGPVSMRMRDGYLARAARLTG